MALARLVCGDVSRNFENLRHGEILTLCGGFRSSATHSFNPRSQNELSFRKPSENSFSLLSKLNKTSSISRSLLEVGRLAPYHTSVSSFSGMVRQENGEGIGITRKILKEINGFACGSFIFIYL